MAETLQNSRSKKFIKDFGVYGIGELGAKLITFLMIPLYTFFVEKPGDYGYFDICLQLCMLFIPVVTLHLRDGAFRHLLETKDSNEKTKIITFVYRTIFSSATIVIAIALIINIIHPVPYLWATVSMLISMSIYEILAQVSRGLGNNKAFISMGLIASFGIGLFSLIFVAWFRLGILGIFLANIMARVLAIGIVESWMRTFSQFFKHRVDTRAISKALLKYSLPLIPVTLCGLIPSLSDRLFLKHFNGLDYSGIYGIATRLIGIINSLSIIFYQTWQENAIQQYNSPDRDTFFSKVFNSYIYVLAMVLIGYVFIIKICFNWIVAPNYQKCLIYLFPLGISCIFHAINSYFYLPYQCAKDTKSAIPSIIITASVNIVLNYLLTPHFAIFGVIATNIIAHLATMLFLLKDTRKYFTLYFYRKSLIPISMIIISIIPFYLITNEYLTLLYIVVAEFCILKALPEDTKQDFKSRINHRILKK